MTCNEFTEIVDKFLLAFITNYVSEDVEFRSTFAGSIVAQMILDLQDSTKQMNLYSVKRGGGYYGI